MFEPIVQLHEKNFTVKLFLPLLLRFRRGLSFIKSHESMTDLLFHVVLIGSFYQKFLYLTTVQVVYFLIIWGFAI